MTGHLLVRRPSPALADGELTHLDREPVDSDLALRQWQGYVDAFATHGWTVQEIEPADEHRASFPFSHSIHLPHPSQLPNHM